MAKYSKKEFADLCGMGTNALAVYIGPKYQTVIVDDDGIIDTDNPTNMRFLEKRIAKGKNKPKESIHVKQIDESVSDDELPTYEESERRVKYFDALKREKEVQKLELDIQKKRGEVIPSELIPPVLLQHNQSIVTSFKNEFDEWLRNVAKKYGFNSVELADARRDSTEWINTAINKATDISISAVEVIVQDYADKRGVGERIGS